MSLPACRSSIWLDFVLGEECSEELSCTPLIWFGHEAQRRRHGWPRLRLFACLMFAWQKILLSLLANSPLPSEFSFGHNQCCSNSSLQTRSGRNLLDTPLLNTPWSTWSLTAINTLRPSLAKCLGKIFLILSRNLSVDLSKTLSRWGTDVSYHTRARCTLPLWRTLLPLWE